MPGQEVGKVTLGNSLKKSYYEVGKRTGRVVDEAVMLRRKFCFISKLRDTRAGLYAEQEDAVRWRSSEHKREGKELQAEAPEGKTRWAQSTGEGLALGESRETG